MTTLKDVEIYDNGGKTLDRITFVFLNSGTQDIFGTRFLSYECLCSCFTGVSFFQHSNCQRGNQLGKKVTLKNLSKELQQRFINYLKN